MPMAHVNSVHSHSLYIMLHAMLNLFVMSMTKPCWRLSSVAIITSMEIATNHLFLERSFFLGLIGGTSSSEASPDSIIHSNWHAKV